MVWHVFVDPGGLSAEILPRADRLCQRVDPASIGQLILENVTDYMQPPPSLEIRSPYSVFGLKDAIIIGGIFSRLEGSKSARNFHDLSTCSTLNVHMRR